VQIYTTTLSAGVLQLNRQDGAMMISIQPASGAECIFTGSMPFKGELPTPIALNNQQVFNLSASTSSSPLDGITITWVSGNIDIVVGF